MPSRQLFANNARAVLASGISAAAVTVIVGAGEGARFGPAPAAGEIIKATLRDTSGSVTEIVHITARTSDTLTILRAQESTIASAFITGDTISVRWTAGSATRLPQKDADETITGAWSFPTPAAAGNAATKQYADDVINGINGNAGYFEFVSTTQLRFARRNGKRIFIEGAWYDIPSAGALLSNSGLSVTTTYYVYAFVSGGVVTLEASTDARATDATWGHQIRTGMPSRTLVGMCRAGGSAQFFDVVPGTPQGQNIGVLSWFNRRRKAARSVSAANYSTGTTGGAWVTLHSSLQLILLAWSDSNAYMSVDGTCLQSAAAIQLCYLGIGYDSAVASAGQSYCMATNGHAGVCHAEQSFTPAEGYHFVQPLQLTGGNTVTWTAGYVATLVEVDG